jgi:NitT/TauT family transport system permease protein/putative hydroxymethylpyrimidine transport system permease protein
MLRRYLPTALLLLAALGVWQLLASLESVDDLTLASPGETVGAFGDDRELLIDSTLATLWVLVLGLTVAVLAGAGAAIAMHLWRPVREAAYPLLIASQAIPIVVVAPLLILAFDYGVAPKVAIVALVCFFPIAVNLLDGLRSVEPEQLKLMRSLGASRLMALRKVELPSALPFLFSGLKVAATVSVIGAVFGEWAGAEKGLGRMVLLGLTQLETPRVYAGVVLLTALALGMFVLVALAERAAVPWSRREVRS